VLLLEKHVSVDASDDLLVGGLSFGLLLQEGLLLLEELLAYFRSHAAVGVVL